MEVNQSAPAWEAYLTAATDFVDANPEILGIMIAGAVVGLIAYAVKRLAKAGR
jgi:hypothetical protein